MPNNVVGRGRKGNVLPLSCLVNVYNRVLKGYAWGVVTAGSKKCNKVCPVFPEMIFLYAPWSEVGCRSDGYDLFLCPVPAQSVRPLERIMLQRQKPARHLAGFYFFWHADGIVLLCRTALHHPRSGPGQPAYTLDSFRSK